ncbi:S1 RNA-binding domain-containing protein, partial [Accumulibacter sp.]
VTNVANFGAFVDIGVHQDGLVHISAIADRFVKDPRTVVKAGDVVKVKVLEVDLARQRIALSMRLADALPNTPKAAPAPASARARQRQQDQPQPGSAMASAFARLKR